MGEGNLANILRSLLCPGMDIRKSLKGVLELIGEVVAGVAHANVSEEATWIQEAVQRMSDCKDLLVVDARIAIMALLVQACSERWHTGSDIFLLEGGG